jgi:hypothetical protein
VQNTSYVPSAHQVAIGATMESAARIPRLDNLTFMNQFHVKATYRLSSDIPTVYWDRTFAKQLTSIAPLDYKDKLSAVAYVNSHCNAPSGRNKIVGQLMELLGSTLPVHGLGKCLHNTDGAEKYPFRRHHGLLRQYRFCIAMENSLSPDYVSEKVYMALAAGSVNVHLRMRAILKQKPAFHPALTLTSKNPTILLHTGAFPFTMVSRTLATLFRMLPLLSTTKNLGGRHRRLPKSCFV